MGKGARNRRQRTQADKQQVSPWLRAASPQKTPSQPRTLGTVAELLTRHKDQLNDLDALSAQTWQLIYAAETQASQTEDRQPLVDLYIEAGVLDASTKGILTHPPGFSYVLSALGVQLIIKAYAGEAEEAAFLAVRFLEGAASGARYAPAATGVQDMTWDRSQVVMVLQHWLKDAYANLGSGVVEQIEAQRTIIRITGKVRLLWSTPEPWAVQLRQPA